MESQGFGPAPPGVDSPSSPTKRRGGVKWVVLGCLGALVLSVILAAILFALCARAARGAFVDDPARVEQIAREMIDYEIPGGSRGVFAMDMIYRMAVVASTEDPPSIALVVAHVPSGTTSMSKEDLERQINQSMEQQMQGQDLSIEEAETRTEMVCGQEARVLVQRGTVQRPQGPVETTMWQTTLSREGGLMILHVNATGPDADATAEQVFSSISCR